MTVTDQAKVSDDPATEVPSSIGLVLTVAAVMLSAVSLAGIGTGQAAAGVLAIAAVTSFAGALVCFAIDGRRHEERIT
jgi:hypothetical protein